MLEYSCKDCVFHFNKKHLEDPSVPPWCIKSHGVTFYVNHVSAEIPWTTKETPDNPSTKGSIKFKDCKLSIDRDNNATLSKLGLLDRRLPHPFIANRIIASNGGKFHTALLAGEFQHSEIKHVHGGCGSSFIICDLTDKNEALLAALKYAGQFRLLVPNEKYYFDYASGQEIWEYEDEELDDADNLY